MRGLGSTVALAAFALFGNTVDALVLPPRHNSRGQPEAIPAHHDQPGDVDVASVPGLQVRAGPPASWSEPGIFTHPSSWQPSQSTSHSVAPTSSATTSSSVSTQSTATSHTVKSTSSATPSSGSAQSTTTGSAAARFTGMRGVNIGGWLILEPWMNSDVFEGAASSAVDQYTFDQTLNVKATLVNHWESYFTEKDVQMIAAWGMNAMRIPIGYWAYNDTGMPYIMGADAYLEKAIGWARKYDLKVLVDCHGSPGSQNGWMHSGREGDVLWQSGDNLQISIDILVTMATKYGSKDYADVVFGLELVNEPLGWAANDFSTNKAWSEQAYAAVKKASTNPDLIVIMHDSFMGPSSWVTTGAMVNEYGANKADNKFAIDTHLYQNQNESDTRTQAEHISAACQWTQTQFLPASSPLPVYVGEFSAQTNICANPDNTTVAGSVCTQSGCQCSENVDLQYWSQPLKTQTRMFFEAQLEAFEHSSQGWFMWSWNGPGVWGMQNLIQYGIVGNRVTDRLNSSYCGFSG
jgi:glucan 1,3-beta-glucosidase